jgi:hypothetical protein
MIYAATAKGTASARRRVHPVMTATRPKVAMNSLKRPLELRSIRRRRRQLTQCADSRVDHVSGLQGQRRRHAVMHPDAVAPRAHQPGPPQVREMPRDRRLGQIQAVVDVADAHLVVPQQRQDTQTRPIRQSLERDLQAIDAGQGLLHISASADITAAQTFVNTNIEGATRVAAVLSQRRASGRQPSSRRPAGRAQSWFD